MALPVDGQEHLIEVPLVPGLGASMLQLIGIVLPKLQTPLADGLIGHGDGALKQDLLHVAVAQREAIIEPDAMADDLAGVAMVLVAFGVSGWRHVGCLFLRFAWSVRGHRCGHYVTGWEGWSTT